MAKEVGSVYGVQLTPVLKEQQDILVEFDSLKDRLLFLELLNRSKTNAKVSFYQTKNDQPAS